VKKSQGKGNKGKEWKKGKKEGRKEERMGGAGAEMTARTFN
jgi:hypothetical protein